MTIRSPIDKLREAFNKFPAMSGIGSRPHPPKKSLAVPFASMSDFNISEGWLYSEQEQAIHGHTMHYGIDFAAIRGTSVYAAADGLAIASSQLHHDRRYQGKTIGYGLGIFIQIWHPDRNIFTLYGHLEEANQEITYLAPEQQGEDWVPQFLKMPLGALMSLAVPIRRGEPIGSVGDSGLSWGYKEVPGRISSEHSQPSWDETHLHFEVFTRHPSTGRKETRYDPYGIYGKVDDYQGVVDLTDSAWMYSNKAVPVLARHS